MDAGNGKKEAEGAESRGDEKRDGAEAGAGKIGIRGIRGSWGGGMDTGNGKEEAEGKEQGNRKSFPSFRPLPLFLWANCCRKCHAIARYVFNPKGNLHEIKLQPETKYNARLGLKEEAEGKQGGGVGSLPGRCPRHVATGFPFATLDGTPPSPGIPPPFRRAAAPPGGTVPPPAWRAAAPSTSGGPSFLPGTIFSLYK